MVSGICFIGTTDLSNYSGDTKCNLLYIVFIAPVPTIVTGVVPLSVSVMVPNLPSRPVQVHGKFK